MNEIHPYHRTSIGSYDLLDFLGRGPIGRVYRGAYRNGAQQKVALKVIEAIQFQSTSEQQQVLEETHTLAGLKHRHILPVLDTGIDKNVLYLACPYMQAGSLRQRLAATPGGLLRMNEVLSILKQVGEALHFAHQQQIVHANVKPENVLFSPEGEAILADFRLNTLIQSERTAHTLAIFAGGYMAPEQFQGGATPLSDQYALACLAYKLLTGHAPFEADSLESLAHKHATEQPLSPARLQPERARHLEQVVLKALSKRPEERYANLQAFLAQLLAEPPLDETIATDVLPQAHPGERGPGAPESPDDEDQTVVLVTSANPNGPFGPAEEQTKAVIVEADAAFPPHPALLVRRGSVDVASAGASQPTPAIRILKRPPVLTAIVSVAVCLSLLGLLFSFFLNPSFPTQSPALNMRSSATTSSSATSTPGLMPTSSPAASSATPVLISMPPAPNTSCRLGAITITQGSNSLSANLAIINTGPTVIVSWMFVLSFSGKPAWVTSVSNGVFQQMGHQVTISSPPYETVIDIIAPGSSVHTSFRAAWNGNNPMPASFRFKSLTCSNRSS